MTDEAPPSPSSIDEHFPSAPISPLPLFKVSVPEAVKTGDKVVFTINCEKLEDKSSNIVLREFEDLEWLHHQLISNNNINGVIVPPLPMKPFSDPKSAESLSRKQFGSDTKVMKGDQFEYDCKVMEKYLEIILSHQTFAHDANLVKFLTDSEAPTRARLNKGIITRLSSAIETARKGGHKDLDENFMNERNFTTHFSKAVKDAHLNFSKQLIAQWRLSSTYRQVATDLTSCTAERDAELVKLNRMLKLLADGMEDEAAFLELSSGQGELSLGFYLDLFSRYSDSLKDMHLRRTTSMIQYETTEKVLEKAKPQKKAMAEEAFESAKKLFDETSNVAKKEINLFTQQRLLASAEFLTKYAELQMKISQDFYSQLFHTRKAVFELDL